MKIKRARKVFFISLFLSVILILPPLSSCHKKSEDNVNVEAEELFSKSVEIILNYTRLIEVSHDSIELDSLVAAFEKEIDRINFTVPPETDFKLSEQENDSLFFLLQNLNIEKKFKFKSFSIQRIDTIESSKFN